MGARDGLVASSMLKQLPALSFLGEHALEVIHVVYCYARYWHMRLMDSTSYESFRAQHKSLVSMEGICLNLAPVVEILVARGYCCAGQGD